MTATEHGRGGAPSEPPLTPVDTPALTHAERARTLVAARHTGTLGTLSLEPAGYPYGSFVTFALLEHAPIFLISRLAAHTRHLEDDPRASLLVAEDHASDPLANGRVTLVGVTTRIEEPSEARAVFLERHPGARGYVDFTDFSFWRMEVETIRYIGGYGRMSWVEREAWADALPDPIAPHAKDILDHMNEDHADALVAYARAFTRAQSAKSAVMTGIDRYGFEISVETERGPRPARLAFEAPIGSPVEARKALVALVRAARAALSEDGTLSR